MIPNGNGRTMTLMSWCCLDNKSLALCSILLTNQHREGWYVERIGGICPCHDLANFLKRSLNLRTFFSKMAAFLIKRFLQEEAWIFPATNAHNHQTEKRDLYYLSGVFYRGKKTRINYRWFFVFLVVRWKYPVTFCPSKAKRFYQRR